MFRKILISLVLAGGVLAASTLTATPAVAVDPDKMPTQVSLRLANDTTQVLNIPAGSDSATPWQVGAWTGTDDELWEPIIDNGWLEFRSTSTGLCAHITSGSGALVHSGDCAWQVDGWTLVRKGTGYQLVDRRFGGCLTAASGQAVTATCSDAGTTEDLWLPVWEHRGTGDPGLPGTVTLRVSADASQVAVVGSGGMTNGDRLIQWPLQDQPHFKWNPQVYQAGAYAFSNTNSGLCANVSGGGSTNGSPIIQWTCGAFANEQWRFAAANTGYQLVGVQSGMCLNVSGGVAAGNWIIQWTCQPGGATNDTWLAVWEPND